MDTEVYFLCPFCNGLTNGKGSGDSDDLIYCTKCDNSFSAVRIGKLAPWTGKEAPERYLYVTKEWAEKYI